MTVYESPDHGVDSMDITSFHPDQLNWSSNRLHRPSILTLWSEHPGSAPNYSLGYLLFNGRLILDYAGNPIRAFRHLPLTISSTVGGFRVEAWNRQDIHRLRIDDILARLRTRITAQGREPLQRGANLFDRAHSFRQNSGLIAFRIRSNATKNAARAFLDSLRTPAQRAANKAIDRDLTPDELATLKDLGRRSSMNAAAGSSANLSPRAPATTSAPAVTMTPAFRATHPRLPSSPPQSAATSRPAPTPAQHLPDSRDDVPKTCKDSYHLNDALSETVLHFKKLTGQRNPKPTNTNQSYTSRWNALQAQFAAIWKSQRHTEETPSLFKLSKWTGGIARWEDDWRTQVDGEERCEVDEEFLGYMDATAEGGAYVGQDRKRWRSVRDTWCNSHRETREGGRGQIDLTSEGSAEETLEESSEQISEYDPEEGFNDSQ